MSPAAPKETARQYRVARQTLSIHGFLRDRFALKSKVAEVALLVWSVVMCGTTFAADDFYRAIHLSPTAARITLGLTSIGAFGFSLTLIVANWKDTWADHRDSARRWSGVVEKFKTLRAEDGTWPDVARDQLNTLYWDTARVTGIISESRFNRLKRRYLRKVAISELSSAYPGCPAILLGLVLFIRHTRAILRNSAQTSTEE